MFRKQLLFTHTYLAPSLLVISPYCSLSRFSTRLRPYPGPGSAEDFEVLMLMFLPELKEKQFPYEEEGKGPTKVLEKYMIIMYDQDANLSFNNLLVVNRAFQPSKGAALDEGFQLMANVFSVFPRYLHVHVEKRLFTHN